MSVNIGRDDHYWDAIEIHWCPVNTLDDKILVWETKAHRRHKELKVAHPAWRPTLRRGFTGQTDDGAIGVYWWME